MKYLRLFSPPVIPATAKNPALYPFRFNLTTNNRVPRHLKVIIKIIQYFFCFLKTRTNELEIYCIFKNSIIYGLIIVSNSATCSLDSVY